MTQPCQTCEEETPAPLKAPSMNWFEQVLFFGRWTLAPIYLFLMVALVIYSVSSVRQLIELSHHFWEAEQDEVMLAILSLVDISMVGNLVVMVTIGGYSIFVRRLTVADRLSQPQWLDHIDSTLLKVKMGLSLIGVSSIQLLKDFVDIAHVPSDDLYKRVALHVLFVLSTMGVAMISRITRHSHQKPGPATGTTGSVEHLHR